MKQLRAFALGLGISLAFAASAATVYNYFPPPGMSYAPTTGLVLGSPTGGAQGANTINATGLFVNGVAASTGVPTTGAANLVYATPNGSSGAPSLRALVGADIPPINLGSTANGGVSSATILLGTNGGTSNGFFSVTGPTTALRTFTFPNASATVLTTNAAVTVPQGGTGLATLTANGVVLGEGTSVPNFVVMGADTVLRGTASADPVAASVPNCGSATTALNYNTTTHAFGCQTISSGTGSVTSVGSGTGITASPNPIVTTGTLAVDQTSAFTPTWLGLHVFDAGGGSTQSIQIGDATHQGLFLAGNTSTYNANPTAGDPVHIFEIVNNGTSNQGIRISQYGATSTIPLHFIHMNGTLASPTALTSGENIMSVGARGYDTAPTGSAIAIEGLTAEAWTSTSHNGTELQFQLTPIGSNWSARANVLDLFSANSTFSSQLTVTPSAVAGTGPALTVNAESGQFAQNVNSVTGQYAAIKFGVNGTQNLLIGTVGVATQLVNDSSNNDGVLRTESQNFDLTTNGGVSTTWRITTGGAIQGRGASAGALVDMTPDTGTYTGTLTGVNATVTNTMKLTRMGNIVCVYTDADFTGTSNTNAMTITGTLPSGFAPAATRVANVGNMQDNSIGNQINGQASMAAGGTITLGKLATTAQTSSTNWTTSGTKGINAGWVFCYPK